MRSLPGGLAARQEQLKRLEARTDVSKSSFKGKKDGLQHLHRVGLVPTQVAEAVDERGRVTSGTSKMPSQRTQAPPPPWADTMIDEDKEGKSKVEDIKDEKTKEKVKSGKYVKENVALKKQEAWPHMGVLKKYARRVPFDQLDFERFVAGESRIILSMRSDEDRTGRLKLMSLMAHWMCRCRDWPLLRNLYDGIVESIEMGEETWTSDFSHYETMIPKGPSTEKEKDKEREKVVDKKFDLKADSKPTKLEVYWCKEYQKGECNQTSPHMSQLKADEKPVPVLHICAACWQKNCKRKEHPETDTSCPTKK